MRRERLKVQLVIGLSLLAVFGSSAQPAINFDSVRQVVRSSNSARIQLEALSAISASFARSQYDSVFHYAEMAGKLEVDPADTLYQQAMVHYLMGLGHYLKGTFNKAIPRFKAAVRLLPDFNRELYFSAGNFMAIAYQRNRLPDSAVIIYRQMLTEADLPINLQVAANGNLGMAYRRMGDYSRAIDHFEICLRLDSTNTFSQLNSILNIGAIFHEMELYPKAVQTLRQGFLVDMEPSPVWLALHNNLAEAFLKNAEYDSAIHYANEGVAIGRQIRAFNQQQSSYRILIQSLLNQNRLDSAELVMETARSLCPQFCNPVDEVHLHYLSGQIHRAKGSTEKAIASFTQVIESPGLPMGAEPLLSSYLLLSELYQQLGDADQSLTYTNRYKALQDSLNNSFRVRMLQEAKVKYETAQKEKALVASKSSTSFYQKLSFRIALALLAALAFVILLIRFAKTQRKQLVLQEDELQTLRKELSQLAVMPPDAEMEKIIHLKSKASIGLTEILFVKSDGHYVEFFLKDKANPEVERSTMKEVEELLPSNHFVRVHKSFIVNIQYIKIINSRELMLENGQWINLSRVYKPILKEIIHRNSNPI